VRGEARITSDATSSLIFVNSAAGTLTVFVYWAGDNPLLDLHNSIIDHIVTFDETGLPAQLRMGNLDFKRWTNVEGHSIGGPKTAERRWWTG